MPSNHSTKYPALQRHSVGDIYPWSIVSIGNDYWVPYHCLTGRCDPVCFSHRHANFLVRHNVPTRQYGTVVCIDRLFGAIDEGQDYWEAINKAGHVQYFTKSELDAAIDYSLGL